MVGWPFSNFPHSSHVTWAAAGSWKTSDMNETVNHQDKHQHIWMVFMIALLYYECQEFHRIPGGWMWLWNDHTHSSHLTSPWHIIIGSHVHSLVPGFRRASTFVRPGVVRFQRVTFGGFSNQHWEYSQGKIGSWWYWCLNGWCFGTLWISVISSSTWDQTNIFFFSWGVDHQRWLWITLASKKGMACLLPKINGHFRNLNCRYKAYKGYAREYPHQIWPCIQWNSTSILGPWNFLWKDGQICKSSIYFLLENMHLVSGAQSEADPPWRAKILTPRVAWFWLSLTQEKGSRQTDTRWQGEAPKTIAKLAYNLRVTYVTYDVMILWVYKTNLYWLDVVFSSTLPPFCWFQVSPLKHLDSCFVAASKSKRTNPNLQRNHTIMSLHFSKITCSGQWFDDI